MARIKLTKGELKRQRDDLKQYERYLPTLQLKKQQLQLEILQQYHFLEERQKDISAKKAALVAWAGLFSGEQAFLSGLLKVKKVMATEKNVAGVDIPVFQSIDFEVAEYDLFLTPLWVDAAIEALKGIGALRQEINLIEQGIVILKAELRITTQRVNLFEKVKIPEATEAIRRIKIYIGDQMSNAVGRSKIAKNKIEADMLEVAI
ncbi:MAG: V-type ATP synthase subunit D [Candidatus Omnitrophica bacterium]|jgi:V/A-type H+-transporting ATPase subunit D|nr:V-type ATP synthase subunit D [Candidatus Omnitrophota bacterium]